MPRGTRHELVGLLLRDGDTPVLQIAGGGMWRLDLGIGATWRARRLFGLRVRVQGIRDGFDILAVDVIERAGRIRSNAGG